MLRALRKILWLLTKAFVVLVLMAVIGAFSTWVTIQVLVHRKEVQVPDLTGMDVQKAVSTLNDLGLTLSIEEGKGQFSDDVPYDHIVKQDPPARTRLKTNRAVKAFLSLGSGAEDIPDMSGKATQKARIELQERGIAVGRIARICTERYPADTIIAQDAGGPKAVSLLESLGPETLTFVMPDLTSYRYDTAMEFLEGHKFRVRTEFRTYEGLRDGTVIETKPHPGYPLSLNDVVSLYVSRSALPSEGMPDGRRPPAAAGSTDG